MNHVFASAADRRLTPVLARYNGVLSIARGTRDGPGIERNGPVLRRLRAVVAQCEPDRDLMLRLGVSERSLYLIRPGIPMAAYREAQGPFTVLFASSPFSEREFVSRGVHLLIQAASRLPDVRFLLIWRRHHVGTLRRLLREAGATNIEVRDGMVADMGAVYDSVHATVLPALEHGSFIPAPRSGLESMAHGKPLLASHYVSIAGSLAETGAGVVFEPTPEELVSAVQRLRQQYTAIQPRAQGYIRERYSPERHLDLHRRLYRAICG
ncbi:MAG TPA: glycosyltransferase [Gemmatimonadales bacterium]